MVLFAQEMVEFDEIVNENKKYALLYYNMKIYDDMNYTNEFIEKMKEIDVTDRFQLIEAYKIYENNDVIYYFSGDCVFSSREAGNIICRIKLTDIITGDPVRDELIADLHDGKYFKDDSIDQEINELGNDDNGLFKIQKKWEIGKSDYLLSIFKNTLYTVKDIFINLENINEILEYK